MDNGLEITDWTGFATFDPVGPCLDRFCLILPNLAWFGLICPKRGVKYCHLSMAVSEFLLVVTQCIH